MTETRTHWETVYATKDPSQVSWYQPHATLSLELIRRWTPTTAAGILDVGGGASTLVDDLQAAGYTDLTVLDVSGRALETAQRRLGDAARRVRWLVADITRVELPAGSVALWHDRAVFHFLTDAAERSRYVESLRRALASGGSAVIATFAPDGPTQCSGLEVARYSADGILAALGAGFTLSERANEVHITPGGGEQRFVYAVCRKA
jgi:SAM-dependent methyltransferase